MSNTFGMASFTAPQMLRVCTRTWMRDSHDLFDYETQQQVKLCQFATSCPLKLLRNDVDVSIVDYNGPRHQLGTGHDHLLSILSNKPGEYLVVPAEKTPGSSLSPQKLWIIVRSLPYQRYELQENDIIKLGRFRLRVKQLVAKSSSVDTDTVETSPVCLYDGAVPEKNLPAEELATMQCRICLTEGGSGDDKLICACECKGSIKYVHVDCLRKWISSRWNIRDDEPLPPLVFIREVSCELCKANYPARIRQNGEQIDIVYIPKIPTPFIVLENVTPHAVRGVHLLSMKDMKDLKLGRGHESDVRIPDVSISRYHATVRYEGSKFYLEDHNSKFGTLVAMRRPKLIGASDNIALQVGRSVIELSLDPTLPFVKGCIDIPPVPGTFSYCGNQTPTSRARQEENQRLDMDVNSPNMAVESTVDQYSQSQTSMQDQLREHILSQLRFVSDERSEGALQTIGHYNNHPRFQQFVNGGRPMLRGADAGLNTGFVNVTDTAAGSCLLPESVFIADWNNPLQSRSIDYHNGDTGTSALDINQHHFTHVNHNFVNGMPCNVGGGSPASPEINGYFAIHDQQSIPIGNGQGMQTCTSGQEPKRNGTISSNENSINGINSSSSNSLENCSASAARNSR